MKQAGPGKGGVNGQKAAGGKAPVAAKVRAAQRARGLSGAVAATLGAVSEDGLEQTAAVAGTEPPEFEIDAVEFQQRLMQWYQREARDLPWRGTHDPYQIWVSEIMLQQTRVAAVIEHYNEFLRRFPTLVSLALAAEPDVLAAWSGLGYYRRARMLHKAAQFIMLEGGGRLPATSAELRTLPGIGEYTAAAIASIAFGEAIAVVDGNVERVILRLSGHPNEATAAARAFIRLQAQALMPVVSVAATNESMEVKARPVSGWDATERLALAASARPTEPTGGAEARPHPANYVAGEHNQAMMELGATICLPRGPLCARCPVNALCRTRGEHPTLPRAPQRSLPVAYLLDLRKRGTATEVLLEHRSANAAVMPTMFELPPLPLEAVEGREPVLRVRHAITTTNYYVQVFSPRRREPEGAKDHVRSEAHSLRRAIPKGGHDLHWVPVGRLAGIPLTGLTRKILQRLHVMENPRINLLEG